MPHIHELLDFTVNCFIIYDDKAMLVNHPRYDKWLPPGGHIELDEDPDTALIREIQEESGLEVEILNTRPDVRTDDTKFLLTPSYMDVHDANPPHKHINLVYFARAKNNKHVLSAEHTEINWLSEADLDDPKYNLSPSMKFYCREALAAAKK